MTSGERINWLQRFERHQVAYSYLALALYLLLNNSLNATTVWMEYSRDPLNQLRLWEPFTWEYSSAIATLLLSPLLVWWFRRHPLRLSKLRMLLLAHLAGSLLFSVSHSLLMVALRELVYTLMGGAYDFGPWLRELFYEYRKDAWGYLFFLGLFQLLQFVYHRLTGDARLISGDDEVGATSAEDAVASPQMNRVMPNNVDGSASDITVSSQPNLDDQAQRRQAPSPAIRSNVPQHFLVKKLDKEFLVAIGLPRLC